MIVIFFLCLKLSILHLCVSDLGYQCEEDNSSYNPEIFLIQDRRRNSRIESKPIGFDSIYQTKLNNDFYKHCRDYYNIKIVSPDQSEKHDNVIRFAVPGYYEGKPLNNFVYAGNISKIDDAVCNKTDKAEPQFDCNEIVNLVSKSVLDINDGHLYNFVQSMSRESEDSKSCEPFYLPKTSELMTVLLCLRGYKKRVNIQPLQLIQVTNSADCSNYLHRNGLLAVLAPEPFEVPSEYSVPTIFYETPYLFSEYKTAFPNSMSLVPWRLLKYGFLTFIQTVGWQRVAIVTDDSEYSLEFEDELTALFNKERIIYTVIRCEDANCEMDKISQELGRVSAKIVIANVEEKHAQHLFRHADHITWLVRDMVGNKHKTYLSNKQVAFSFSLRIDGHTKGCDVEDNILTSLSSIAQAYKYITEEDDKGKKRFEFYRRFASITKQVTPRITEATVVVHKLNGLQEEEISTMSVNAMGAKLISFKKPSVIPPDGTAHCLVKSYDYHKPCEDPLVVFLITIVMLFVLTLVLITIYFDKTSPFHDIRYQNF